MMNTLFTELWKANRRGYERERGLYWAGLCGLVLGLICLIASLLQGSYLPADLKLMKPLTFDVAIGIFTITFALLLPSAGWSEKGRRRFRFIYLGIVTYSYAVETVQAFRGVDPRFGGPNFVTDVIPGILFSIVTVVLVILLLWLSVRFFQQKPFAARPILVLAIRYGMIAVILGIVSGIWMAIIQSRFTGAAGNIMLVHFFGFHGFQAIPMIGWLLEKWVKDSSERETVARNWVHAAGWSWILAATAVTVETYLGEALFQIHPLTGLVFGLLGCWLICLVIAVKLFLYREKQVSEISASALDSRS
jgi:hypothetical protein